jgi:hypothetical protein
VQIVPATAGEAVGVTTEQELVARLDAEAGKAHGPIVVAGELYLAVVNVFFLPPFGRHAVPTKWGFFLFYPQTGGYFFPTLKKIILRKTKNTGRFFSDQTS